MFCVTCIHTIEIKCNVDDLCVFILLYACMSALKILFCSCYEFVRKIYVKLFATSFLV